ncbi:MAG: dienelactone hydrolase family protein [Pseudobdellovibrionaceae bacterium]
MPEVKISATDGGQFSAYIALPQTQPAPAIVVIQEIFGVNKNVRDICDKYAAQGYVAIAPDLFWRLEPNVQLTDKTEEEWAKAFDLMNRFNIDKGVEDIQATTTAIRNQGSCNGVVGAIGFCLGGKLAYLTATRTDIDASVGYYGVQIDQMLDEAVNITAPLMLHIAEEDKFVDKAAQTKIIESLKGNAHVTLHSYKGVDHAFTRIGGDHYDANAAQLAHERTDMFLAKHLGLDEI